MQPLIHFHARLLFISTLNRYLTDSFTRSLTELAMFVPARDYTNLANDAISLPFLSLLSSHSHALHLRFFFFRTHRDIRAISVTNITTFLFSLAIKVILAR